MDDRLIFRVRSNAPVNHKDRGKLWVSVCEGVNAKKCLRADGSTKDLIEVIKDNLRNEIFGKTFDSRVGDLIPKVTRVQLLGVLLYEPNMTINFTYLVDVNARFEDVAIAAKYAGHREEFKELSIGDAPLFYQGNIGEYFQQITKGHENPNEVLDGGCLGAALMVYPLAKEGYRKDNEKHEIEAESSAVPEPAISHRQIEILQAMLEQSAVDSDSRVDSSEIAEKADKGANPEGFRQPLADLKKLGYIQAKLGAGGGYWLTATGCARAKSLSKK